MKNSSVDPGADARDGQFFRRRWKDISQRGGWRFSGDWSVPEVDVMIEARSSRVKVLQAAKSLGASRAYHGVGVRETMLDFSAFFEAAESAVDEECMRDLVEGWTAENARIEPVSCTDVYTGMSTRAHLERVIYDLCLCSGPERDSNTIAILHLQWPRDLCSWSESLRSEIGQLFLIEFLGIDTTAAVEQRDVYILMPRTGEAYAALARFARKLEEIEAGASGLIAVSFRPVPVGPNEFTSVAAEFRHDSDE